MKKIILIACGKQKKTVPAKAKEMYTGTLFKKSLHYAQKINADEIFILSAKYGLLELSDIIYPYNLSLSMLSNYKRKMWALKVITALSMKCNLNEDSFTILSSKRYYVDIVPALKNCEILMENLTIGKRLHFLNEVSNG